MTILYISAIPGKGVYYLSKHYLPIQPDTYNHIHKTLVVIFQQNWGRTSFVEMCNKCPASYTSIYSISPLLKRLESLQSSIVNIERMKHLCSNWCARGQMATREQFTGVLSSITGLSNLIGELFLK